MGPTPRHGELYLYPEIRSALTVRRHPEFETIRARGIAWADRFLTFESGLERERFLGEEHCLWTCLLFPTGDTERVQDICDLTLLQFALDDAYLDPSGSGRSARDARRQFEQVMGVIAGRDQPRSPWESGMRGIWDRFERRMPARQRRRLIRGIEVLHAGALREVTARLAGELPDLDGYMRLRRESVGAPIYLVLNEYVAGTDLSADVNRDARLRVLHRIVTDHLILTNDVFSFEKERSRGDPFNALEVLRRSSGYPLQRIADDVRDMIEVQEREFIDRREALRRRMTDRPDVLAVLDGMEYMLSGNLHWSYTTTRYHQAAVDHA